MILAPNLGRLARSTDRTFINPLRLPNIRWMFDMTDNSTVQTSSSLLTTLYDKSGNNNHSVPTGTQRGTVAIDGTTGKQVLQLNGTSNFLPLTNEDTLGDFTLFLVYKTSDLQTLSKCAASTSNSDYIGTSGVLTTDRGNITINNTTDGSQQFYRDESLFEYCVLAVRKLRGQFLRQQINGRDSYLATPSATFSTQKIGQLFGQSGNYVNGSFAGGCLFSDYKSDTECDAVMRWFYNQHNLAAVPRKNIFMGDSITNFSGNGFVYQVSVSEGRHAVNNGINGTTFTINGSGISFVERWPKYFAEYPYNNFHTIMGGTNDATASVAGSAVQSALDTILAGMIAQGTPAQNIRATAGTYRLADNLGSTVQDYESRAATVTTNRGTKYFNPYLAFKNGGADTWMTDTLHANQTGHNLGYTPCVLAAS